MDFYKDLECAIFDLDGTLVNSIDTWRIVDEIFMQRRGLPIPEDFYDRVATLNMRQAADYVIAECGVKNTPDEVINEWLELLEYEYGEVITMVEGAQEFLKKLKESGVKLALATASHRELFEPCLKRHGVYDLFDAFVTTDEVKRKKGFPDVYLLAAKKVGAEPEKCCVFEDIYLGCVGAKAGNMHCVAILEEHSSDDWDDIKRVADKVIYNYNEIM